MEISARSPLPSQAHPSHALAIYAEPLLRGRRVLVVGDATSGLGERVAEQGARIVHVYDPDAARAQEAGLSAKAPVAVFPLPESSFDVRDGAFDLAIIPDLPPSSAAALLARIRKLVGPDGALIFGARNREAASAGEAAFDYYELYDLVSLQFSHVRMVAELPFAGMALAELGQSNPEVSVDTQLAPEGPAPRFIVVASQTEVPLDPYAIIQLPEPPAAPTSAPDESALRTELEIARGQLDTMGVEVAASRARSALFENELAELRELSARGREAEARAGDSHVRAERLTQDIRRLEEELERQRARGFKLTQDFEDEKKARTKAEIELGMLRKNPELAAARARIVELEVALSGVEKTVIDDRVVRSNLADLEAAVAAAERADGAEKRARAELAEANSRLEALEKEIARDRALKSAGEQSLREAVAETAQLRHTMAQMREVTREQLEAAHKDVRALKAQLDESRQAEAQLLRTVTEEQQKRAAAVRELETYDARHAEELGEIERTLHERAKMIHLLESELGRRERLIRELVQTVEELHAAIPEGQEYGRSSAAVHAAHEEQLSALRRDVEVREVGLRRAEEHAAALGRETAGLRAKLDALAVEAARREGDVQTSTWRIAELERELEAATATLAQLRAERDSAVEAPRAAENAPDALLAAANLKAALDQIDLLKTALVQEHATRQRLESGEELSLARAEVARQAVLLEQLSR